MPILPVLNRQNPYFIGGGVPTTGLETVSKTDVGASPPKVRIPVSPPLLTNANHYYILILLYSYLGHQEKPRDVPGFAPQSYDRYALFECLLAGSSMKLERHTQSDFHTVVRLADRGCIQIPDIIERSDGNPDFSSSGSVAGSRAGFCALSLNSFPVAKFMLTPVFMALRSCSVEPGPYLSNSASSFSGVYSFDRIHLSRQY